MNSVFVRAICFSGAFFYKAHTGRFNADSYQSFLSEVLAQTTQHLIIIQDGARYHTSKAMNQFFAQPPDRLSVYQLPTYSPDFNPIEYLWRNIKKQATHLRYFPTFEALVEKVDAKLRYFAHTPKKITNLMGKYCNRWALTKASMLGFNSNSFSGKTIKTSQVNILSKSSPPAE